MGMNRRHKSSIKTFIRLLRKREDEPKNPNCHYQNFTAPPHLHADDPEARIFAMDIKGLPHAHGDESKDVQIAKRYVEVCPVHTGMNRHLFLRRVRGRYLPRIYGDTLAAKRNTAA